MNNFENRKCDHPEFCYCAKGVKPLVFVFNRLLYKTPSAEQIEQY